MISQGPEDIEITSGFGPLRPLMDARWEGSTAQNDPDCVKTPRGITAPGILGSMVMRRTKKRKNLSSARHHDQIRFRFHTTKTLKRHWLCTAAMVLMPDLSPIKVLV
jgi:hypothetical protein